MNYLDVAYKTVVLVIGGLTLICGIIGLFRGWFKTLRKFGKVADNSDKFINLIEKGNLFIDQMLPDLFDHFCKTHRVPKDTLKKWTTALSSNNLKSTSPLNITDKGYEVIRKVGIDTIFEANKLNWTEQLKKENKIPLTKYDLESACINLVVELFNEGSPAFNSIKNYFYEHPNETPISDIYALTGILLRNYILKEHPELFIN